MAKAKTVKLSIHKEERPPRVVEIEVHKEERPPRVVGIEVRNVEHRRQGGGLARRRTA